MGYCEIQQQLTFLYRQLSSKDAETKTRAVYMMDICIKSNLALSLMRCKNSRRNGIFYIAKQANIYARELPKGIFFDKFFNINRITQSRAIFLKQCKIHCSREILRDV